MRRSLVIANWKMNGSADFIDQWTNVFTTFSPVSTELAVCPPFVYIRYLQQKFLTSALDINVGAQDCSVHESGAFTGEVSAGMLADVKCPWVIVGHSERRQYHGESNEIVAAKAKIAIEHGLRPIVCVGETLEERESGRTSDVVIGQLNAVLDAVGPEALVTGAVAYEPVWAIGTGKTATPQQAQLVHAELRDSVESRDSQAASALRIIYGGSVKPSNAAELFACNDIDGALQFVSDLLEPEIIKLRFWGKEGDDYCVDENGLFYLTEEQEKRWMTSEEKRKHFCFYSYFPRVEGRLSDGINAFSLEYQTTEFYKNQPEDIQECFSAYGVTNYVDMIGNNEAPGAWYPMYSYTTSLSANSPAGQVRDRMDAVKHKWLPQVIMAEDFETAWEQYMKAYDSCNPEIYYQMLQLEVEKRVKG